MILWNGMSVYGMKDITAFVVHVVFYIYRFSQKVVVDVNYISSVHYRDLCSTVNALGLPCVASIKAEIYPFVRSGSGAVVCPPSLRIMK